MEPISIEYDEYLDRVSPDLLDYIF